MKQPVHRILGFSKGGSPGGVCRHPCALIQLVPPLSPGRLRKHQPKKHKVCARVLAARPGIADEGAIRCVEDPAGGEVVRAVRVLIHPHRLVVILGQPRRHLEQLANRDRLDPPVVQLEQIESAVGDLLEEGVGQRDERRVEAKEPAFDKPEHKDGCSGLGRRPPGVRVRVRGARRLGRHIGVPCAEVNSGVSVSVRESPRRVVVLRRQVGEDWHQPLPELVGQRPSRGNSAVG
mmetsp:Transcript_16819/g.43716  ORF Transcript_16819/g.43716 Transcript_16819/m.43716 type:complete len:234 (+) Transcript_16819:2061-2762(+)